MRKNYPARAPPVQSVTTKPEYQNNHQLLRKGISGLVCMVIRNQSPICCSDKNIMEFFSSAVTILQTLVVAIGAGLGVWGVINLMEGYGNDNPGANAHVR